MSPKPEFKPEADVKLGANMRTVEDVIDVLAGFMKEDIDGQRRMTVAARAVCSTVLRLGEEERRRA